MRPILATFITRGSRQGEPDFQSLPPVEQGRIDKVPALPIYRLMINNVFIYIPTYTSASLSLQLKPRGRKTFLIGRFQYIKILSSFNRYRL
jgi:hypothetical protein